MCGIELARCTTPIAVNGTALRIEALDAHWASVLATLEEAILAEVQALVPKVEALQIELSTQSDGAGSGKGTKPVHSMDPMATDLDGCLDDFLSAWHRSSRSKKADLGPHDAQD